jgi:Metallo-beta-lactamase superfamily
LVDLDQPKPVELEISLFGPGYGESMALHVGNGRWMVVDSCTDSESGRSAVLAYLERIGVDCAKNVVAVLATHWHDDHVRGLGEVVRTCESSRFLCSAAFRSGEFLALTQSAVLGTERTTSGVNEFARILEILRQRKRAGGLHCGPDFVLENTIVLEGDECELRALSPSSAAIEKALAGIASMLPERRRPHLRIAAPTPNEGSVALWFKGAGGAALLGADVERRATNDRGWGAILAIGPERSGRAGLVKLPHHGSESGHDDRMWGSLLERGPGAMLTPWSRGARVLPTDSDRDRIVRLAPGAVIVGRRGGRPNRYDPAVERMLREVTRSRRVALGRVGHARARCGPSDEGAWRVEAINEAGLLANAA